MKGVRQIFTLFWADTAAAQAPCAQNHLIPAERLQSPVATAPAQTSSVRCADSFPRGEAFWDGDPKPQTGGQPRLEDTAANLRPVPSDRRSDSEGPVAARAARGRHCKPVGKSTMPPGDQAACTPEESGKQIFDLCPGGLWSFPPRGKDFPFLLQIKRGTRTAKKRGLSSNRYGCSPVPARLQNRFSTTTQQNLHIFSTTP